MLKKFLYKIHVLIKFILKRIAVLLTVNLYQRPMAFSIIYNEFPSLQKTKIYKTREELWDSSLLLSTNPSISYVEFGVLEGYSIDYFSKKNSSKKSTFIGLDSFEGLPDDWDSIPKGTLNVGGKIPKLKDNRISFLKGWFIDTSSILLRHLNKHKSNNLVVNFDADLYSSTLYSLTEIDSLKKDYIAIFDEFAGHEARALYNYSQSHNAKITFLGRTLYNFEPWTVLCKITPHKPIGIKK